MIHSMMMITATMYCTVLHVGHSLLHPYPHTRCEVAPGVIARKRERVVSSVPPWGAPPRTPPPPGRPLTTHLHDAGNSAGLTSGRKRYDLIRIWVQKAGSRQRQRKGRFPYAQRPPAAPPPIHCRRPCAPCLPALLSSCRLLSCVARNVEVDGLPGTTTKAIRAHTP